MRQGAGQGRIELWAVGHHARAADLEDQLLAELLPLDLQCLLELLEAALAEGAVGSPVSLVEGPPGGVDGPMHVRLGRVRDLAEHRLRGRIDARERLRLTLDELAVDQHPRLEPDLRV